MIEARPICQTCSNLAQGRTCAALDHRYIEDEYTHCVYYKGPFRPIHAVIICATPLEYAEVRSSLRHCDSQVNFSDWENFQSPLDGQWSVSRVTTKDGLRSINIACGRSNQLGLSAAASITTTAIHLFRPMIIAMLGICAGRSGATGIGDVLVASEIWDYGAGRWEESDGQIQFRPRQIQKAPAWYTLNTCERISEEKSFWRSSWLNWLERSHETLSPEQPPEVRIGPLASGSAIVDSKDYWNFVINQNDKVIGLEMEAYGFAVAAEASRQPFYAPEWLVAKAVCDFGAKKTKGAQPYASYCSASFFSRFLYQTLDQSLSLRPSYKRNLP